MVLGEGKTEQLAKEICTVMLLASTRTCAFCWKIDSYLISQRANIDAFNVTY